MRYSDAPFGTRRGSISLRAPAPTARAAQRASSRRGGSFEAEGKFVFELAFEAGAKAESEVLFAESERDRDRWVEAINRVIEQAP